ncbi:MAG TPA: hypothetical protein VNU97_09465 [Rhizomicrobium sp.]|jgi:hypothetical protein|nr:hypothetical protein [Rhizomicrobium sp.]
MRLQQWESIWPAGPAPWDPARLKARLAEAIAPWLERTATAVAIGALLWTTLIVLVIRSGG